jgi:hypothetical protein
MPQQHNGIQCSRVTFPTLRCTDPAFIWIKAVATDVTKTWARFGFTPKVSA